jgi:hypothetical protein
LERKNINSVEVKKRKDLLIKQSAQCDDGSREEKDDKNKDTRSFLKKLIDTNEECCKEIYLEF